MKHIALDWTVDFDASVLKGSATLTIVSAVEGLSRVVLDTRDLAVEAVAVDGKPVAFSLGPVHEAFGAALTVALGAPLAKGGECRVAVSYATSPNSTALQWLTAAQTAGRSKPYLFSQCQAIHARSMLPCVDAPGHKATYEAKVTVPGWATVLMSALATGVIGGDGGGPKTYSWSQPVACSSYLIAVAVGDLESRDISPRCRVWSEPSMVTARPLWCLAHFRG